MCPVLKSISPLLVAMLTSKPTGIGKVVTDKWEATNRMSFETFLTFWKKVSPDLNLPGSQAGDDISYAEWTESIYCKYQGMQKPGGAKHGIVREIGGHWITEATYFEDKRHGLSFTWLDFGDHDEVAFEAHIYNHGEKVAYIKWAEDWSEISSSGNKELILQNGGLSLFKP